MKKTMRSAALLLMLVVTVTGCGKKNKHEYVDLGLPSGTLWATCNVGATTPEDYGDYYAWGETTTKTTYNWSTYQWCNGSGTTLTKYCNDSNYGHNGFTDDLTELQAMDDAATANWGSGWKTPTSEQWQELKNNTTSTWTTQNSVNGWLLTASNGNSIFLPAAGSRWGDELYDAGNFGFYWSSTLYTSDPINAWRFYFNSDDFDLNYYDYHGFGQSVRPVRQKTIENEIVSDGNDDMTTEEIPTPEIASNDYKWLEGVWAAEDEETHESVKMIITDTYFQFNRGFTDAMIDKVEDQPKEEFSIKTRYNVTLEKEILSFNEFYDGVGIDVERRCPYVVLGEFSPILYLEKIEEPTTEAAIAKANQQKAPKIHGITDPASYTWADENLYGKVQSFIEEGKKEGTNSGYCVTKKFDDNGRIVYYKTDMSSACGIYPFNMDNWLQILPMEDKINYTGSQLSYFMLDHNLMNPVHMICYKPSDSPGGVDRYTHFNGEATYKYNMLGQISDLYINNKTHYEFEYDIEGRVTKAIMNGKPTFKISWSYYGDNQHLGYSIKFYSQEGYDAGEFKYAWKSNDVLATVHNTGKKEEFSLPEFTFYEYPQVKTVVYGRGSIICYFYNDKGRLTQVIKPTSESLLDYSENRPEDFFMCSYTSYQYNEKGDVVSISNSEMLFKKKNMNNMSNSEFINYLFRNNFDELLNRSYKDTPLSNSVTTETIWRYEYDGHGNWTKRERYEVVHGDIDIENLKDITTRKYVYYE